MEAVYKTIALTGPTLSEHCGPVSMPISPLVDVVPECWAGEPFIQSRGNVQSQISFSCQRRYASLLESMQARATFLRTLPLQGHLTLTQLAGGQVLTVDALAWLGNCQAELFGISVKYTFSFFVKQVTAHIDTPANFLTDDVGQNITDQDDHAITTP